MGGLGRGRKAEGGVEGRRGWYGRWIGEWMTLGVGPIDGGNRKVEKWSLN